MNGHIASLRWITAIFEQLAYEILEAEASLLEYTRFSILAYDHIV